MKSLLGKRLLGAAHLLAGGMFLLASSDAHCATPGTAEYMGMRVSLSLSKTELVLGEPLFLQVDVLNENAPLRIGNFSARLFASEGNDIEIRVQAPGELPKRYSGGEEPGVYSAVEIDLNNAESMNHSVLMLHDPTTANGYLFHSPGVYTVSATLSATILRDPSIVKVTLPPTRITVTAPEGKNAEAFAQLNNSAVAQALQQMNATNPAAVASARKVAEAYPDSPYAPLCRMLSAYAYYRSQPPQREQAAKDLQVFLNRYPDYPRAGEAAFLQVVVWATGGNLERARDWFFFVRDAYPNFGLLKQKNYYVDLFFTTVAEAQTKRPWWMYERPWEVPGAAAAAAARQRGDY